MNQRACLFFKSVDEAVKLYEEKPHDMLHSTNKFRVCVLFENEQFEFKSLNFESVNKNSVILVHEVPTASFTYSNDEHPVANGLFLASDQTNKIWFHDVDVWVGLPPQLEKRIKELTSHTFFHTFDEFFLSIKPAQASG